MRQVLIAYLAVLLACPTMAGAQVFNLSHPDNLRPTTRLGCIALQEMEPRYTPADLMGAVRDCLRRKSYEVAYSLMQMAQVYAFVDRERITDRSVGGAWSSLVTETFQASRGRDVDALRAVARRAQGQPNGIQAQTCVLMRQVGPPDYVPLYMIAHGLGALDITGNDVRPKSRREMMQNLKRVDLRRTFARALAEAGNC